VTVLLFLGSSRTALLHLVLFNYKGGVWVFCNQCGEKLPAESKFCANCGAPVAKPEKEVKEDGSSSPAFPEENGFAAADESLSEGRTDDTDEVNTTEVSAETSRSERKRFTFKGALPVVFPLVSILLVAFGLSYYYIQEKEVNAEVLDIKKSAEETALKGDYEASKKLLEEGISKRPAFIVLQEDLELVDLAIELEGILDTASSKIKKTEFEAASKGLVSLKSKINNSESPLFEPFKAKVEEKEVQIAVGTIKKELNGLKTVDELAGKLSILAALPEKEATPVKTEILNKIIQISTDDAEGKLKGKQFTDAFSIIDKGLEYASNDKKLLAFRDRVEQERSAFEQAEQQRIEQAMEAAAQEDLKNRTAAVEVLGLTAEVDEYGDLYVTGEVKNTATAAISSVTIYYSVYDANNSYITEGSATVYPYYLEPGESGSFDDIYYGIYQDATVTIDNITWYLN
jgi:zinc-ribbon domain